MSEEIKEILEALKHYDFSLDVPEKVEIMINKLLDCITSLQEEKNDLLDMCSRKIDEVSNLQKDNKKLKELCDKYEEEHKTTFEYWKHLIKEDYKTRIDKAIEYINEMCLCSNGYCDYGDDLNPEHIINKLKGDNK